jgi:hypothetical protein
LASGPVITPLRALDIVAWHAGRSRIGPAIWTTPTSPEILPVDDEGPDQELAPEDEAP